MALFLKRCPARWAFLLELPIRRLVLRVERLVQSLPLAPDSRVLDLGAGSGVVAESIERRLRPESLVLCDAQVGMLRRARRRLRALPIAVAGVAEAVPFGSATFDIVLLVTVLGELDDAPTALREIWRVLRPGGMLSISEHLPDPDFRSLARVRTLVGACGFAEAGVCGSRWSYTANFTKRAARAQSFAGR